ncbi:MAG TPA: DUF2071 domain-containing protein [Tepidisphaeraceae bacterium]|jgi:hypothetical protein|nr:DUF2071 domain-containing protein [Tepidisphaeraceae bacterium]
MHPSLQHLDHRPWALPVKPWDFRQRWMDLLFAHWPIPASSVRHLVPAELEIDEFDGTTWVGVVPFRMEGIAPRRLPSLPWVSAFAELNLRLYVRYRGKPGVFFISLDAANPLAVWTARRFFHLPYFNAQMTATRDGEAIDYHSRRVGPGTPVTFKGRYWPTSDVYRATAGSLEHFLIERYCLFTKTPAGVMLCGEVHHAPWPVQRATAEITENTIATGQGIPIDGPPALLHFSRSIDVALWRFTRADAAVTAASQ